MPKFPIKGWKWIFYCLGWFSGALNPIFWLWQLFAHYSGDESKTNFIRKNPHFHKRVYGWGIFASAIYVFFSMVSYLGY